MEPDVPINSDAFARAVEACIGGDVLLGTGTDVLLVERVEYAAARPGTTVVFSEMVPFEVTPQDRLTYDSYAQMVERSPLPSVLERAAQQVLLDARGDGDEITIARLDRDYVRAATAPHQVRCVLAPTVRCQARAVPGWLPRPHGPTHALVDGMDGYRFGFVVDTEVAYLAEFKIAARGRTAEVMIRVRRIAPRRARVLEVRALEVSDFEHALAPLGLR